MSEERSQFVRDLFSHWVPTGILVLGGALWKDAVSDLNSETAARKEADRVLASQMERLAEKADDLATTVQILQVEVVRMQERYSRNSQESGEH